MAGKLAGRSALITGGSHGIGRGIGQALAAEGADVFFCHLEPEADGEVAAQAMRAHGVRATALRLDISEPAAPDRLFAAAVAAHGKVDILVNNAAYIPPKTFLQMTDADFEKSMRVLLHVPYLLCRRFADAVIASRPAQPEDTLGNAGVILNIASASARNARADRPAYSAAKAGLVMLSKALAWELGPHGIRVISISPGVTRTKATAPFFDDPADERWRRMRAIIPLRRPGEPADFGHVAAFLASPEAAYITGLDFALDGGFSVY